MSAVLPSFAYGLAGCKQASESRPPNQPDAANDLSSNEQQFVSDVAERIIPATDTPGAIEAGVPAFIAMLYRDWLLPEEQAAFRQGIAELERDARNGHGRNFSACDAGQQHTLLMQWDEGAFAAPAGSTKPFFLTLKQLIVSVYYTSEVGQDTELETVMDAGENASTGPINMTPPFRI